MKKAKDSKKLISQYQMAVSFAAAKKMKEEAKALCFGGKCIVRKR